MPTLLDRPDVVQCDPDDLPEGPTPADAAWYLARLVPDAVEPPKALATMLDWVHGQRCYYASLSDCGDTEMALVCGALVGVWSAIEMHRPATVRGLLRNRFTKFRGVDLAAVRLPGERRSILAAILDYEAERFLGMGSDLATLCAWAILRQADDVERFGSATVEEYLDAEAAERQAWEDAAADAAFGESCGAWM